MTSSFDLIIFERGNRLSAVRVPVLTSNKIFDEKAVYFQTVNYSGLQPFGEWLALCNDSRALVGVAIVCVTHPDIVRAPFFQAKNISKHGEDFHILLAQSSNAQMDGWPFTTVYTLRSGTDDYILYIPEFYAAEQTVSLADNFASESLP
jgi:hypothetical protein